MARERQLKGTRAPWAPGASALADAARAITLVAANGRSADDALAQFEHSPDRAAIRAITLGSLRWYLRLAPAIEALLARPQRSLPADLRALLIASAHQVEYSRNAPQATVHLAVDAARMLGHAHMAGLANAVLRRFVAERVTLLASLDVDLAVRHAHPQWLVAELHRAWPQRVETLLAANNRHPPMVLRVNRSRIDVSQYLDELAAAGLHARALQWAPAAVELDQPLAAARIPGFGEGRVSVQDAGAQLAAPLLDPRPGQRVLDACAAPGGKTAHVLEYASGLSELVAVDIDEARLHRVHENLQRLQRTARLVVADMRLADALGAEPPFERILVDAPCSSTGVIRRHPDIKLLRRPGDIRAFAVTQLEILRTAFRSLAPGGRLVYCTCSVLPAENEEVVSRFLAAEPRSLRAPMPAAAALAPGAVDRSVGVQLLPDAEAGTDGFYYACVEKATA